MKQWSQLLFNYFYLNSLGNSYGWGLFNFIYFIWRENTFMFNNFNFRIRVHCGLLFSTLPTTWLSRHHLSCTTVLIGFFVSVHTTCCVTWLFLTIIWLPRWNFPFIKLNFVIRNSKRLRIINRLKLFYYGTCL